MTIPLGTETEVPTVHSLVEAYSGFYDRILPTGSRAICPDAVTPESDEDYLMLVSPSKYLELEEKLRSDGWVLGGSLPNGSPELLEKHVWTNGKLDMTKVFHSWKLNNVESIPVSPFETNYDLVVNPGIIRHDRPVLNIILTCNQEYFDDFTRATFLAKRLGLTNNIDRVIVFKALCQDEWPSGEGPINKTKTLRIRIPDGIAEYATTSNLSLSDLTTAYNSVYGNSISDTPSV